MKKNELYRRLVEEITLIDVNRFSYSDSFRAGEAAGKIKGLEIAKKLLNQLDEPDSIDECRKGYEQGVLNVIQTANESKLVEIPQFVADYIKKRKKSSYPTLADAFHDSMYDNKISGWLEHYGDSEFITDYVKADKNQELFTLAWNNGYTITPESKMKITIKSYDKIELEIELSESESKKLIDQLKEVPNV